MIQYLLVHAVSMLWVLHCHSSVLIHSETHSSIPTYSAAHYSTSDDNKAPLFGGFCGILAGVGVTEQKSIDSNIARDSFVFD